jgi:putative zinc finger protein
MRCQGMEDQLVAYLDGRARPAERRAVEEHLTACADCRARAAEFRAVWSALDDLPAISPSPAFDAALRARLAAEPVRRRMWPWMQLPSPRLAFAVTALAALSIWIFSMPQVNRYPSVAFQPLGPDAEFSMIRDLPELENFEVISKFDALSELPVTPDLPAQQEAGEETR